MYLYTLTQPDYKLSDLIEGYKSLIWTERFQTYGEFELQTYDITNTMAALPLGTLVTLQDTLDVHMVEDYKIALDDDGIAILTVTGRSLAAFLKYRPAIKLSRNLNDGAGNPYTWSVSGDIASCTVQIIAAHILRGDANVNDAIPNVNVSTALIIGPNVTRLVPRGDLYEAVQQFLVEGNLGLMTWRPFYNTFLNFYVVVPYDRTNLTFFMEDIGDFKTSTYLNSIQDKITNVYAASPAYNVIDGPSVSGFARRDYLMDASDITDTTLAVEQTMLKARADSYLTDHQGTQMLDCDVSAENNKIYKTDYNLGDLVSCRTKYGLVQAMQVMEYVRVADESGDMGYPTFVFPKA